MSFTKIANPKTASPTLKVIKINSSEREFEDLNIIVIIIILLNESISKTKRREIKWFFLFVIIKIKIAIHKKIKKTIERFWNNKYVIIIRIKTKFLFFISKKGFYWPRQRGGYFYYSN